MGRGGHPRLFIIKGLSGVVKFPVVPGIDMVSVVSNTLDRPQEGCSLAAAWDFMDENMRKDLTFSPVEPVLITGNTIGQHVDCVYSTWLAYQAGWLVRKPGAFTLKQSMALGTAGHTAMMCIMELEEAELSPKKGDVLVTCAAGGLGSIAVVLLAARGYRVVAST